MKSPTARRSLAARASAADADAIADFGPEHEADPMRLHLLMLAERLFAEHGVENTPLQRIVAESGQRNRSALNYHFGSRRDLLAALLNMRTRHVNERRHQYLDSVEAAGLEQDIPVLVRATYQPLLDVIADEPWGGHFVQVVSQVLFNPILAVHDLTSAETTTAMRRVRQLLGRALPALSTEVLISRMTWATDVVMHSLARWCRDGAAVWAIEGPIDDMFDFIAHGLTAPVTVSAERRGVVLRERPLRGLGRLLDPGLDLPAPPA